MIGIFDSGVGGLTVMRAIRDRLPSTDVTYFGDIKHAPYGERTREELSTYTVEAIKLLQSRGADRIVSACNSLSASMAVSLFDAFDMAPEQLVEMVGPTVSYFRDTDAKIGLCATTATVKSDMYENAFRMVGKDVISIPMPGLAGAIEFGQPEEEIEKIIRNALPEKPDFEIMVLACTHYPLVKELFQKILGPEIEVFDPAEAVAMRAEKLFWPQEVRNGATHFVISQDSDNFRRLVAELFPESQYEIEVII